MIKHYVVRCDGFTIIDNLYLTYDQYKDQKSRDIVRKKIAKEYCIPTHYLRLMERHRVSLNDEDNTAEI